MSVKLAQDQLDKLASLIGELRVAQRHEKSYSDIASKAKAKIAAIIQTGPTSQRTVNLDEWKVIVSRGVTYNVDVKGMEAAFEGAPETHPIPLKQPVPKKVLDMDLYQGYKDNDREMFLWLSRFVEAKPKTPTVKYEEA